MYQKIGTFLLIVCVVGFISSGATWRKSLPSDELKVALRTLGHQLLLDQGDSASIVLPVREINQGEFEVSFEKELSIKPYTVVQIAAKLETINSFPQEYLIEIVSCSNQEVAYSFHIKESEEDSLIPCCGRDLPKACYSIKVNFPEARSGVVVSILLWSMPVLAMMLFIFQKSSKKVIDDDPQIEFKHLTVGDYIFFPDQLKLVYENEDILLSIKECEILQMLLSRPNQLISREELTKKVWEDNGVFVGRSLDTFISKLRKKLKNDPKISISNLRGVGYKLEIK